MTPDTQPAPTQNTVEVTAGYRPDGTPILFHIPLADDTHTVPPAPVSSVEPVKA
jgi:hypothetical protein